VPHDPDGNAWRRAIRATVVVPTLFGLAVAAGSDVVALYVLFGAFTMLVFGDYGGPTHHRITAYVATTVAGLLLIVVGTALSESYVAAAIVAAFVAFALTLGAVIGPAVAQLRTPLVLAFVLPASVPAPFHDVDERLQGWALGGVVSLVVALLLFPRRDELEVVTDCAAKACSSFAGSIAPCNLDELGPARALAAASAFGATRRRRALVLLIDELQEFNRFAAETPAQPLADEAVHDRLAASVRSTLAQCAASLRGDGELPDLEALDLARAAHRQEVEAWAERELQVGSPELVIDALDAERPLRLLSQVTLGIATCTTVVAGAPAPEMWHDLPPRQSQGSAAGEAWRAVRAHFVLTSVRLHDALRAGAAIGLSLLVAGAFDFQHGFWVVLGALAVLRTSVLAEGKTAVEAVVGTAIGFLAAFPLLWLVGTSTVVPWILLPPLVFLAAFAGGVLPFAVGQMAFTMFVVLAIDIIVPKGWHTGEIRLIDVMTGAAVSVIAGLVFWPRGAHVEMRRAIAALYRSTAALLAAAFRDAMGTSSARTSDARRDDADALNLARSAVEDLVAERGHAGPHVASAVTLVATGANLRAAADRIGRVQRVHEAPPETFVRDVEVVAARFDAIADAVDQRRPVLDRASADKMCDDRRTMTVRLLNDVTCAQERHGDAFALVWLGHWLLDLEHAADDLIDPVADLSH
jgi:uncharacterized membrane protein YccC